MPAQILDDCAISDYYNHRSGHGTAGAVYDICRDVSHTGLDEADHGGVGGDERAQHHWKLSFDSGRRTDPPLGIAGVAISSTVSRLIGLGLLIVLFNLRTTIEVHLRSLSPFPWGQLKKLLAIGIPSGGESVSYNLSQMVITKIVNGFGTAVINTRVYANMFAMVSYMYGSAVSQAAQILVGVLIGGRKLEDAHKQVMHTIIYSLIIGVGVSTLLYIFSDSLFGLFTDDLAVLRLGKQVMLIEIFLEAGRAVNMTQVRALQAAGDIQFPILLGIASQWGVAVTLSFVFAIGMNLGVVGVWLAMMMNEVLRAILFLLRWYSGKWKTRNLIEN